MIDIFNKKYDFVLIKFPFVFPTIYGLFLILFPNYESYLIALTVLFLAEPHFGATWPIFVDTGNKEYFLEKKIIFYFGVVFIFVFSIAGFFYFKNFFFLLFYLFNVFHVTRQSIGICKLYNKNLEELNYQIKSIYFLNFLFFLIGLFRFYFPIIDDFNIKELNFIVLFLLAFFLVLQLLKFGYSDKIYTYFTGMVIFYPICFVSNPVHAILWGVTMHYSQYLAITSKVYFGRKNQTHIFIKGEIISFFKSKFFIITVFYSIIMTLFNLTGKMDSNLFKSLLIIPITGQMLHFYLDTFIWRFRDEHNREYTLKHILKKI